VAAVPSATVTIVEKSKDTITVCARNDNAILLVGLETTPQIDLKNSRKIYVT
jgi:hypothetical protein